MRIQKNLNDLTERYEDDDDDDDDESDKHLEARDRRYSCLTSTPQYNLFQEFTSKCWVLELLYLYSNINNRHGKTPIAL